MYKTLILLPLLVMPLIALAGTIDPKVEDDKVIVFGQKEVFDCVIPLIDKTDPRPIPIGSGVVIKPNYILTAAHIFYLHKNHSNIHVFFDKDSISIDKVTCHKLFNSNKVGFYDIAICRISKSLYLDKYPVLHTSKKEINNLCFICGYGSTGTFDTGATIRDGRKRAGTNIVESISNHVLVCNNTKPFKSSNMEFLIADGDSGGALFIANRLAGINSFVYTKDGKIDSSWNDVSGHTRVSLFIDWINQNSK
jgi:hypothetical protein